MSSHLHYSKISWAFRVFSEILTSMVYISRLVKAGLDGIPDPIDDARRGGLAPGPASRMTPADGKAAPEEQTGLKVGARVPRFTLKDQEGKEPSLDEFLNKRSKVAIGKALEEGKEHSLDEFLNKGKVALVFYRSADW